MWRSLWPTTLVAKLLKGIVIQGTQLAINEHTGGYSYAMKKGFVDGLFSRLFGRVNSREFGYVFRRVFGKVFRRAISSELDGLFGRALGRVLDGILWSICPTF